MFIIATQTINLRSHSRPSLRCSAGIGRSLQLALELLQQSAGLRHILHILQRRAKAHFSIEDDLVRGVAELREDPAHVAGDEGQGFNVNVFARGEEVSTAEWSE